MAWVTPPTFVSGNVLTAAQLNILAADLNETAPGKASVAGQHFVSTGANAIAVRTVQAQAVSAAETYSGSANVYSDLATIGPQVTCTTGAFALVMMSARMENSVAGGGAQLSFAVSGATTAGAPIGYPQRHGTESSPGAQASMEQNSHVVWMSGLQAGSNTFTLKYTTPSGGTATFAQRLIVVMPF